MSRLSATLRLDTRLQARNRVYWIVAIASLLLAGALRALFSPEELHFFMPLIALSGVSLTTFILVGVLLLLERDEGTLDVILVSPLRPYEYLASKLVTLCGLALAECLLITTVAYGVDFSLAWLVAGLLLRALFVAAVGVAVGVRYRSITAFLLPIVGLSIAFDLPALWYLGLWPTPLFQLWPTMPSLLLVRAAFFDGDPTRLACALAYGSFAAALALAWASRAIHRFVVRGEGTR